MDRRTFLEQVLAPAGYISIRGLRADKSEGPKVKMFTSFDEADEFIAELEQEGREVYFSVATFKDNTKQSNVPNIAVLKSFFLDVDCGPGKDYATAQEGLQAAKEFCKATGLPRPTIISSGNGFHLYWILEESCGYNEWKKIGIALKQKVAALGFRFDPAVTGDGARILRVPDTMNTKDPQNPKPVTIIRIEPPIALKDFSALIPPVLDNADLSKAPLSALTKSLMGSPSPSLFSKLLTRSLKKVPVKETIKQVVMKDGVEEYEYKNKTVERSDGCPQIAHAYTERETLSEPLWWAALSIAQACTDNQEAIIQLSQGHPEFDPHEAFEKAAHSKGPRTCKEYQLLNPAMCNGCIHRDRITSPVQLGSYIELAKAEDNVREDIWHRGLQEFVEVEIPDVYPHPWARPKTGGVAYIGRPPGDDDDEEPSDELPEQLVYENDIWVKKRLNDPVDGMCLLVALILPRDGLVEFIIPQKYLNKKDKGPEVLASYGVTVMGRTMNRLLAYLMDWVKFWQKQDEVEEARAQFGFHDKNDCFVIGTREIRNDGSTMYSPPSSMTCEIAPMYETRGDLPTWKNIVNNYGKVGNEVRAFTLFASFGAPLYNFYNMGSMIIHLTNSASGVGKSTAQKVAGSVWGHPNLTLLNNSDTQNARLHRFGVLRHLPLLIDEITNIAPDELSKFAFDVSQNRGRNRMEAQSNSERRNNSSWNSLCITSGNNSLYDTLKQHKASVEGEMYRILELTVEKDDTLTKKESDYIFDQLLPDNYGLAGQLFMEYVVSNLDIVRRRLTEVQAEFDKAAGFESKQRFYSACCGAVFTGAEIAKHLGLHDIDIDAIKAWAIRTIGDIKESVAESSADDSLSSMGKFLNDYGRHMLIINGLPPQGATAGLHERPIKEPIGELYIRYEPDTKLLYIDRAAIEKWCSSRRVVVSSFLNHIDKSGILMSASAKKRLSEGTSMSGLPVPAIMVNAALLDLAHLGY